MIFKYYRSLADALAKIYPDFPWEPSKFVSVVKTPRVYWNRGTHLRDALEDAAQRLGIQEVRNTYQSIRLTYYKS